MQAFAEQENSKLSDKNKVWWEALFDWSVIVRLRRQELSQGVCTKFSGSLLQYTVQLATVVFVYMHEVAFCFFSQQAAILNSNWAYATHHNSKSIAVDVLSVLSIQILTATWHCGSLQSRVPPITWCLQHITSYSRFHLPGELKKLLMATTCNLVHKPSQNAKNLGG